LEQLGLEGNAIQTAVASVERYNELCDGGKDLDFGKKATRMTPVRTAPFYGCTMGLASNLCNIGGLISDEDCHTFDKDTGAIIGGLYVAGSMQGSKFTVQYPIAMEGAASGLCMYYGYVAGKNAAAGV
jgi:predicted oxidoreductase